MSSREKVEMIERMWDNRTTGMELHPPIAGLRMANIYARNAVLTDADNLQEQMNTPMRIRKTGDNETLYEVILDKVVLASAMLVVMVVTLVAFIPHVQASESRIKDIASFEGVRDNMLMGYGLVVGLNGTGDKLKNNAFTEQSLVAFLERQGVNTRGTELKSKNVAAVTVTAALPAFSRSGGKIDVSVSAMGDAKSLQGGTLLATALSGADGAVYAVAQGAIAIGGFSASGASGSSITKGVPTSGSIANGAIIEKEIEFALNDMPSLNIALRNPDLTTAKNVAETINKRLGDGVAMASDSGTVQVTVPPQFQNNTAAMLADIETLPVETDQVARVVIDEASGTIVMGENVRIDTVAVAQGNLVVKIEETPQVSQPSPFAPAGAETVVVPRSSVSVDENSDARMTVLNNKTTLKDLVAGLNALGVGPRDLITILQTIKSAGALQAEIETR